MAGANNRSGGSGRAAGGSVSAPPKPSGMKVNLFQQASREAQQRNGRAVLRTARRRAELNRQPERLMGPATGGRKNIKGRGRTTRADAYRRGILDPGVMARQSGPFELVSGRRLGFRAPRTRLL
jgi:hypothetical protein